MSIAQILIIFSFAFALILIGGGVFYIIKQNISKEDSDDKRYIMIVSQMNKYIDMKSESNNYLKKISYSLESSKGKNFRATAKEKKSFNEKAY